MSAPPILIDRVAEAVAPAGHVVQRRAGADLVEVDPHRLRGVEGAGDGAVADSRQPQIVLDSLSVPTHEHTFAHDQDEGQSNAQMLPRITCQRCIEAISCDTVKPQVRLPAPKTWDEFQAGVAKWLNEQWGRERPCPYCGNPEWDIGPAKREPSAPGWPNEEDDPRGRFSPVVPVICTKCGHVVSVHALWIFERQEDSSNDSR